VTIDTPVSSTTPHHGSWRHEVDDRSPVGSQPHRPQGHEPLIFSKQKRLQPPPTLPRRPQPRFTPLPPPLLSPPNPRSFFFNPSDFACEGGRARGARVSAGDGSSGGGAARSGVVRICLGFRGPVAPIYQRRPGLPLPSCGAEVPRARVGVWFASWVEGAMPIGFGGRCGGDRSVWSNSSRDLAAFVGVSSCGRRISVPSFG